MKSSLSKRARRGFTLMETVIAIGVLAVLLSSFLTVFGPAAAGIRRAISAQEADRLASTLEREMGTLRANQTALGTAFDKAYAWIKAGKTAAGTPDTNTILVYQYRGDPSQPLRADDGTMTPYTGKNGVAGTDYVLQPMARVVSDSTLLQSDLSALEGRIFAVQTTQLVFKSGALSLGTVGTIVDPKTGASAATSTLYGEAVIAFTAEFYSLPSNSWDYVNGAFKQKALKNPIFTRNLAVRR